MKQHFALTLCQNRTNWTGRDSVVAMCLPWMADHISLARALITARMNGFVTTAKFHEMIMSRSLLRFISCLVAFRSVQGGKNAVVICAICKKRFKSKVSKHACPVHSFLLDMKKCFGSNVVMDCGSWIWSTCTAPMSMHKKTGETFEHVSAQVGSSSCRHTLNTIHKELEKDLMISSLKQLLRNLKLHLL